MREELPAYLARTACPVRLDYPVRKVALPVRPDQLAYKDRLEPLAPLVHEVQPGRRGPLALLVHEVQPGLLAPLGRRAPLAPLVS